MNKLQTQIERIKQMYADSEIRRIFALRLDEDLFESLGRTAKPLDEGEAFEFVWLGYELLVGKYDEG